MQVSVCLATYNGGRFIQEQMDSILPQLNKNDEVIISDDGSTDNTISILKGFNDERIKIFQNKYEKGYSNNFEHALECSKGDIIFICDQDDVWEPDKVACMIEALRYNDVAISDALICDETLQPTLGSHFKLHKIEKGFIKSWTKMRYIGACMAFKRDILEKILPFPKNKDFSPYDYWIAVASELYYKVALVPKMLIRYRRHSNTASTGGLRSNNTFLKKVTIRFYALYYLAQRVFK